MYLLGESTVGIGTYILGTDSCVVPCGGATESSTVHRYLLDRLCSTLCTPIQGLDYAIPLSRTCNLGSGYLGTGMFQSQYCAGSKELKSSQSGV